MLRDARRGVMYGGDVDPRRRSCLPFRRWIEVYLRQGMTDAFQRGSKGLAVPIYLITGLV